MTVDLTDVVARALAANFIGEPVAGDVVAAVTDALTVDDAELHRVLAIIYKTHGQPQNFSDDDKDVSAYGDEDLDYDEEWWYTPGRAAKQIKTGLEKMGYTIVREVQRDG